jgi:hypothetical protein
MVGTVSMTSSACSRSVEKKVGGASQEKWSTFFSERKKNWKKGVDVHRIVVLPALSSPKMRMRTSLLPNNAPKTFDITKPMVDSFISRVSGCVCFYLSCRSGCVFCLLYIKKGGQSLKNLEPDRFSVPFYYFSSYVLL